MKATKTIGLAAFAALAAMAFVGASSAMAETTTLCSADGFDCGVTHVHETSVGTAKLLTSFGTGTCEVLFLGDVKKGTSALATTLKLEGSFVWAECRLGGKCTLEEENGPALNEILKEGHETGKVTYNYLVHMICGTSIDCSYITPGATALTGTAKGPLLSTQANGEVSIFEKPLQSETGGFLCPKTFKLDVTLTPLTATYISS